MDKLLTFISGGGFMLAVVVVEVLGVFFGLLPYTDGHTHILDKLFYKAKLGALSIIGVAGWLL